jgi:S1-C subfamily serine protease
MVRPAFLLLLATVSLAPSAGAQSLLKQLQAEVAAISAKTRRAVVTIEDAPLMTQVMPLQNVDAGEMAKALNLKMKSARPVVSDARTNSLVVTGVPESLSKVQDVVKKLDKPGAVRRAQEPAQKKDTQEALKGLPQTPASSGKSGSGFSIGDGYVVTTADVVDGMVNPIVVTDTGARIKADVAGTDKELNVGLLRLSAQFDIPSLKLGDSSALAVGHFAISIGNQSGQDNSVALMMVGGIRKEGTYSGEHFYPSLIQIAGTVGAGTSGAPLLNADGEVVGIMAAMPADGYITVTQAFEQTTAPVNQWAFNNRNLALGANAGKPVDAPGRGPAGPAATDKAANQTTRERGLATKPVDTRLGRKAENKPAPTASQDAINRGRVAADQNTRAFFSLPQQQPNVLLNYDTGNSLTQQGTIDLKPDFLVSSLRPSVTSAGFAVPINELKPAIESLKAGREIVRGWIGVELQDEQTELMADGVVRAIPHVRVGGLYTNSPALKSGIQPGDLLLQLNGEVVGTGAAVRAAILRITPPAVVDAVVEREGKKQTVKVAVEPKPKAVKTELLKDPIKSDKK